MIGGQYAPDIRNATFGRRALPAGQIRRSAEDDAPIPPVENALFAACYAELCHPCRVQPGRGIGICRCPVPDVYAAERGRGAGTSYAPADSSDHRGPVMIRLAERVDWRKPAWRRRRLEPASRQKS